MSNAYNNFDTSAPRLYEMMIQSGLYSDIQKYRIKCYTITKRKGRYGESDKAIGLTFFGSVGAFKQLPQPREIIDYEKYKDVSYYLEIDKPQKDIEVKDKNNGYSFDDYPD